MKRVKVMTIVGTRPEIIRLSRVVALLREQTDHTLVHTGQNYDYELNQVFFDQLELGPPDRYLDAAGRNPSETIGRVIIEADKVIEELRPEAVLVLGDTNSCMAALAAKRRRIPVFHMEAGNRCFDERVPEEINRRIIDHISDINMPYSSIAREYLLREGIPPDRIIKTGSPMFEVLHHYMRGIDASKIMQRLKLTPRRFYLVSAHREENVDDEKNFGLLIETLGMLATASKTPIIVSTHPRTRRWLVKRKIALPKNVVFLKPLGFLDYVKLQKNALAVLSDSGTITEESSILNFPALNIRETHERPEGMEEGAVILTGLRWERVAQGLDALKCHRSGKCVSMTIVRDYEAPAVSQKVLRVILGYTDYVNRMVWRRPS